MKPVQQTCAHGKGRGQHTGAPRGKDGAPGFESSGNAALFERQDSSNFINSWRVEQELQDQGRSWSRMKKSS